MVPRERAAHGVRKVVALVPPDGRQKVRRRKLADDNADVPPGARPGRPARARARRARLLARAEDLRQDPGPVRGAPRVGVLRGPAHGQRHAGRPPHRGARLQGRLPPLPDHARLPRGPQGRLGLPRSPGGAGGREGAGLHRQAGHRGVRHRRVQRQVPRLRDPAHRRLHRADDPHGLLGRPRRRVPHDGPRVHRVRLVVAQGDLQQGPAGPGLPRRPLVPPRPDGPLGPRAGSGLRDGRRPLRLRPFPAHLRSAGRPCRTPGLDDDPLDTGVQHGRRRPPRGHLRRRDERRGAARRRRAAAHQGPRRGLGDHR